MIRSMGIDLVDRTRVMAILSLLEAQATEAGHTANGGYMTAIADAKQRIREMSGEWSDEVDEAPERVSLLVLTWWGEIVVAYKRANGLWVFDNSDDKDGMTGAVIRAWMPMPMVNEEEIRL